MADVHIADVRLVVGNGVPGPVPFTIFDVIRTITSDAYDPRLGVHDAVGKAIANAPFAPVAWHFPALEVAPFPGPQIVLCRYFEQRTVIVDLRDCSLGLHVFEIDRAVDPLRLLSQELQTQLGPRVRSNAVQATLNGGTWNLGFTRWLRNGDVVVWRPIPASAILVPQGLRVSSFSRPDSLQQWPAYHYCAARFLQPRRCLGCGTHAACIARAFLPIFLKSHFRLTEPVQFKSTALIALFKGKGSPAVLANHRAIALLDGPGKALRRSLRPTFVALLPAPDQQQGGAPGSLLAGAHHLVRAHQQLAIGLKVPAAALFLDVSSAYYRVLRQAFGKGPLETDEDVAQLLTLLQVPPSALHEVCEWLSQTDLLAGAPAHCTALIRAFLSGTFFQIRGAPGIVRTRAGSRPGDSVADLLFSLITTFLGRSEERSLTLLPRTLFLAGWRIIPRALYLYGRMMLLSCSPNLRLSNCSPLPNVPCR